MPRQSASITLPLITAMVMALTTAPVSASDSAQLVKDFNPGLGSTNFVGPMAEGAGVLIFARAVSGQPLELWSSGGSATNTIRIGSPEMGNILYQPTAVDHRGYFFVLSPAGKEEWWSSDGTVAGTRRMATDGDIAGIRRSPMIGCGGQVYLIRSDSNLDVSPYRLWCGNGYNARVVATLPNVRSLTGIANAVFFISHDATYRDQLWSFDTTTQTTGLVRAFAPGTGAVILNDLVAVQSRLFFTLAGNGETTGLWCSDGTTAGTIPLGVDMAGGGIAFGNRLLFHAYDAQHGMEPWISDGTRAGTVRLADIVVGTAGSTPSPLVAAGDQAFFVCNLPSGESQLWRTDGSPTGTRVVLPQLPLGALASFAVVGRELFFTNHDDAFGPELWRSDGTTAGTSRVTDINLGPADSGIMHITEAGGRIFMQATDGVHGQELWSYEADTQAPRLSVTAPTNMVQFTTAGGYQMEGTCIDNVGVIRLDFVSVGASNSSASLLYDPVLDAPMPFNVVLPLKRGITRIRITAHDEADNRTTTQRILISLPGAAERATLAVNFLSPSETSAGKRQLADANFPGALLLAMNGDGAQASTVSYRLSGSTSGEGMAHRTTDDEWQIDAQTFNPGTTTIDVTAQDADGQTATTRMEVAVPQAESTSPIRGCGAGSGIAGLLMLTLIGLRRRLR